MANTGKWTHSKAFVLLYFAVMWPGPNVYGLTKQEAAQLQSLMLEVKAKIDGAMEQVAHTREHSLSQRFVFGPPHATAYACGESGTLQLSCAEGKTLLILDANYGRTSTDHVCRCSTCRTDCRAASSLSVVRTACQGEQQCSVRARYTVFGVDPCWGVQKYLEASYRCIIESNVAQGKTATASSHPSHWGPGKAVDGSRGTSVSWYNQCLHTNRVYEPWWKVDLGGADSYTVNRVSVLNRGDCCGERLRNFQVRVGPDENLAQNDQCGETYTARPANGATIVVYCDQPMSGRYVSIQVMGRSENLQICEVEVFAETVSKYISLGCWRDSYTRALPTLEGSDARLDGSYGSRQNPIEKCYQAASSRGFTVFAVQNGGQCFGSADGLNTFNRHGSSTACAANGKGGPWGNNVYKITGGESREYISLGCWRDTRSRVIPTLEGSDARLDGSAGSRQNPIEKCYQVALSRGFPMFALQYRGECYGSANGLNTFNRYGSSTACTADGEGGAWANEVYRITG
ncbi:uncharacterized protein LOC118432826 [Branchiostoma floridae]|uniref:Uncharacterized protein LOC118432826 n=1 Tax=Branchiostoma floridae TaxID=7739 RepID=A0A9J7MGC4_BRAFL|nr:uncharacterized protein LOC118432826 [Branchiostoma floridae]